MSDVYDDPFGWDSYDTELVETPLPAPSMTAVPIIAATPLPAPGLVDLPLWQASFSSQADPNDIWGTNTAPATTSGKSFFQKALDFAGKLLGGSDAVHPTPSLPGPSGTKTISYTQKSASQNSQSGSMIGGLSVGAVVLIGIIGFVLYLVFGKNR